MVEMDGITIVFKDVWVALALIILGFAIFHFAAETAGLKALAETYWDMVTWLSLFFLLFILVRMLLSSR